MVAMVSDAQLPPFILFAMQKKNPLRKMIRHSLIAGMTGRNDMACCVKDKHITSVYSTNTPGTLNTAKPTADDFNWL
jgi:hypothetical protein